MTGPSLRLLRSDTFLPQFSLCEFLAGLVEPGFCHGDFRHRDLPTCIGLIHLLLRHRLFGQQRPDAIDIATGRTTKIASGIR